jgi:hypothetical protein
MEILAHKKHLLYTNQEQLFYSMPYKNRETNLKN